MANGYILVWKCTLVCAGERDRSCLRHSDVVLAATWIRRGAGSGRFAGGKEGRGGEGSKGLWVVVVVRVLVFRVRACQRKK